LKFRKLIPAKYLTLFNPEPIINDKCSEGASGEFLRERLFYAKKEMNNPWWISNGVNTGRKKI